MTYGTTPLKINKTIIFMKKNWQNLKKYLKNIFQNFENTSHIFRCKDNIYLLLDGFNTLHFFSNYFIIFCWKFHKRFF